MTAPYWSQGVVRLWSGHSYANGTFLGSAFQIANHCLLTARHVVDGHDGDLFASGPAWTGIRKVLRVIKHDTRDVAALIVEPFAGIKGWILPLENSSDRHPRAVLIEGTLAGYTNARTDIHYKVGRWESYYGITNTFTVSSAVAKGMSGGPFVVGDRVVGVIQGRDESLDATYVVPIAAVRDFLRTIPGVLATEGAGDAEALRIFVQVINPEIMKLYGHRPVVTDQNKHSLWLYFRYAFLIASDCVIMPASYLFEVEQLEVLLRPLEPLLAEGALYLASPAPNLDSYREVKEKREYRDRERYGTSWKPELVFPTQMIMIPRVLRSTFNDIKESWGIGAVAASSWFGPLMERLTGEAGTSAGYTENLFMTLPGRLQGRAFVQEYVERLLPLPLMPHERLQLSHFLSREYLLSYLKEYGAFVLNDTPSGRYDCGIGPRDESGHRLTVSMRELRNLFGAVGIRQMFEDELQWEELCELRSQPIVRHLARAVVIQGRFLFRPDTWQKILPSARPSGRHRARDIILETLEKLLR